MVAAQVGVVTTINKVVGYGLGKDLLVRKWSLSSIEPMVKHQCVSEIKESISRLVQPDGFLALGLAQELLEFISFEVRMRAREVGEEPLQLLFRRRAYFEPHELGRFWRINSIVFGVGKLLAV